LENDVALFARFARLGITGGLMGGGFEVVVAASAASAAQENDFLLVVLDVGNELAGVGIENNGADGDFYDFVFAVFAVAEAS
jgi:hypothetical protein